MGKFASVRVPKTAMHEYDFASGGKDDIRISWKFLLMQPEPVAQIVNHSPHSHFRLHIPAADCPHIRATIHDAVLVGKPELLSHKLQVEASCWEK